MIDKYKKPRVQRMVPYRGKKDPATPQPLDWAREMAGSILGAQRAINAAKISGAMPGDCSPWELRAL